MEEKIVQNQQVEFQSQPPRAWFRIALFLALGVVLVGGLVFAGAQIGKRQTRSQLPAYPTLVPRAVATLTPPAVVIPTEIPLATSTPITILTPDPAANWKTYTNTKYGYSVKYPLGSQVKEDGYPNKDMRFNTTFKGEVYVCISAPDVVGMGCGRSGVAYEIKETEELVVIGGKQYLAGKTEEMGPGETLNFHNETMIVKGGLDGPKGKLGLSYGSALNENSTYQEYLKNKRYIYQILSTFRFLE